MTNMLAASQVICSGCLREALFFWFPTARPFISRGATIAFFLNGRFVTNFGHVAHNAAFSCGFTFFFAPARLLQVKLLVRDVFTGNFTKTTALGSISNKYITERVQNMSCIKMGRRRRTMETIIRIQFTVTILGEMSIRNV